MQYKDIKMRAEHKKVAMKYLIQGELRMKSKYKYTYRVGKPARNKRNGFKMREFSFEKDEQGKQQSTDATTTHQQHPHLGCINSKRNYKKWNLAST